MTRSPICLLAVLVMSLSCARKPALDQSYSAAFDSFIQGDLKRANQLASSGAERLKNNANLPLYWQFRLLHAEVLIAESKAKEAEPLLAGSLPRMPEMAVLELRRQLDQVELWSKNGRMKDAVRSMDTLLPAIADPELMTRGAVLYGSILAQSGSLDAAQTQLQSAVAMARERSDRYQEASALLNLSYMKLRRFRLDEAVTFSTNALATARIIGARRLIAASHVNLCTSYNQLGDPDRSMEHCESAVKILTGSGDLRNLQRALGELGNELVMRGEPDKASVSYQKAFELAKDSGNLSDAANWAINLVHTSLVAEDPNRARLWNETAARLTDASGDQTRRPLIEWRAAKLAEVAGDMPNAIRLYRSLIENGDVSPAVRWSARADLGAIYARAGKFDLANQEYEKALRSIDEIRSDLLDRSMQITFLSQLMRFYQGYVAVLVEQHKDQRALEIAEASRARVLSERLGRKGTWTVNTSRITRLAAESRTTLLTFWLAPERSYAWLITARGMERIDLKPAAEIEKLVSEYRKVVEGDPLAGNGDTGGQLWSALLGEIAPKIPKGSRVVVIPDGALHRLNLETLRAPDGHYWLEDVELAVAPSLSVLRTEAADPARSMLLIGAPSEASRDYPPLANAARELQGIHQRFPGSPVLSGDRATPAAYRAAGPGNFAFIHFAAHAEANRENPLASAVILSRQDDQYKLYARDMIDIPIRANLVTISSCKSAGVRAYGGEGLIGFAWVFLQAGARSVIAGLWDVSDNRTEALMKEMYAGIAEGLDPIAALHRAKLAMLRGPNPKPYFWAPFQIYVRTL